MGLISLFVRQAPSSLSPSANSVGIGRNTFDISLMQAIVLGVSVISIAANTKAVSAMHVLTHLTNRYSYAEGRMMTYKWVLAMKKEWEGIFVQYCAPEGHQSGEPFCSQLLDEDLSYGQICIHPLIQPTAKVLI